MERGWVVVEPKFMVCILFECCQVYIHSPELLPILIGLLPDDV